MTKKVLINKQGKAIINKHHNNFSHLTPEQQLDMFRYFKNDEDKKTYLKGEIIIDTDPENPSIYILNNNNEVVKISGNGSGGEGSYDDTELKRLINAVSNNLDVLRGDDVNKSVRTIAEEVLTEGIDLTDITESIDNLNELIGETSVESQINTKIGELPSDKTVVNLINEETSNRIKDIESTQSQIDNLGETYATIEKFDSTKSELESKITTTQNTLDYLIGNDKDKSAREIATDEATKAVTNLINGAPEAYDTLKEISDWIIGGENVSGVTAADMLVSIDKNKTDIANEITARTDADSVLQSQIDDIKDDYLTSSDKTKLNDAISAETSARKVAISGIQTAINTIKEDYLKESDKQILTDSIKSVTDIVTGHTETISSIQQSVSTLRGDFDANTESVGNSITALTNDITNINSELDSINTTIENVSNDVININTTISTIIDTQIPLINETVSGVTTEVTNIKEEISGYTESINEISKTTKQLNEKVDDTVTNFNTLSDTVSTFENSINTNTENINTLLTNVSANTETLNVLTGDEEGSINKKIIDTKTEIDSYTINGKLISDSPTLISDDLNISENYQIIGGDGNIVHEGRITPEEQLTIALAKLETMLLTTTLAITASLNDLEARIGNPSQYDEEGNLIKESNGLFKRIEDLEK